MVSYNLSIMVTSPIRLRFPEHNGHLYLVPSPDTDGLYLIAVVPSWRCFEELSSFLPSLPDCKVHSKNGEDCLVRKTANHLRAADRIRWYFYVSHRDRSSDALVRYHFTFTRAGRFLHITYRLTCSTYSSSFQRCKSGCRRRCHVAAFCLLTYSRGAILSTNTHPLRSATCDRHPFTHSRLAVFLYQLVSHAPRPLFNSIAYQICYSI